MFRAEWLSFSSGEVTTGPELEGELLRMKQIIRQKEVDPLMWQLFWRKDIKESGPGRGGLTMWNILGGLDGGFTVRNKAGNLKEREHKRLYLASGPLEGIEGKMLSEIWKLYPEIKDMKVILDKRWTRAFLDQHWWTGKRQLEGVFDYGVVLVEKDGCYYLRSGGMRKIYTPESMRQLAAVGININNSARMAKAVEAFGRSNAFRG